MNYRDSILELLHSMQRESAELHKAIRKYPKGTISISSYKQYIKVCRLIREGDVWKKRGITKKPNLIRDLLRKADAIERAKRIDANVQTLSNIVNQLVDDSEETIRDNMPANFQLLSGSLKNYRSSSSRPVFDASVPMRVFKPVLSEEEIKAFSEEPYRANSFALKEKKQSNTEGLLLGLKVK